MRIVLFFSAFLLAATSIMARNLIRSAMNQTSFSKKDFADTIKVKVIDGIVLIPVEIEGTTKHFLLDTGAQFGMWFGKNESWMKPMSNDTINVSDSNIQETKQETWRSQTLSSADGGCSFRFMLNDSNDKTTPYEDIRSHLAAIVKSKITFSIGTMEDGRAKMNIALMGMPVEHRLTFHFTCPEENTVDMWGDGAEFIKLAGSDYYSEGVTSKSMGDLVTGGTLVCVGSWTSKTEMINMNGEVVDDDNPYVKEVAGQYSSFSSYGTDIAGHDHPYISAPGSMIISAVNHFDPYFVPGGVLYEFVVAKDDDNFSWAAQSGTSMATPTVAGIIALWLEAKPNLTYEQIRETIAATATKDEFTEAAPIRFGHGKIDAYKGLLHVLGLPTSIPSLSQHQPEGVTFRMKDGRLFIDGAEDGTPIRIYTTDGQLVASAPLTDGCVSLPLGSPAGVYAVQVGTLGSTLIRVQ